MKNLIKNVSLTLCLALPTMAMSADFSLSSSDISHGDFMSSDYEFIGFGCKGKDFSPSLSWQNPPKGTKSFAVTAYDPDAPTGSGWWHWQIVNIPKNVMGLKHNAGKHLKLAPKGSLQIENDYGKQGFGGACPPQGNGAHRYQFTVHALSVESLPVKANSSAALVGYMINANSLASSQIEALYKRNK